MRRDDVDFHAIPAHQHPLHERLANWARWCNGGNCAAVSAMFRLAIAQARAREIIPAFDRVDSMDAARIAKGVIALPFKHRAAINWFYVKPVNPRRAAASIGVPMRELASLVVDARQMMINRGC